MEIERGSTRWPSQENWVWKRLRTCRKTESVMMMMMMMTTTTTTTMIAGRTGQRMYVRTIVLLLWQDYFMLSGSACEVRTVACGWSIPHLLVQKLNPLDILLYYCLHSNFLLFEQEYFRIYSKNFSAGLSKIIEFYVHWNWYQFVSECMVYFF